jgi:hypothetical protein
MLDLLFRYFIAATQQRHVPIPNTSRVITTQFGRKKLFLAGHFFKTANIACGLKMSSRPPGHDRFSQMSEQASIIARKKAEIEAKLTASNDGGGGQGSITQFNKLNQPQSSASGSNRCPNSGKASKNQW